MNSPLTFKMQLESSDTNKETLIAILHTILFHRVFGIVQPLDVDTGFTTYCTIKDEDLALRVESVVMEVIKQLKYHHELQWMIELNLMERKYRKAWFSTTEEEVSWESWYILLSSEIGIHNKTIAPILMGIVEVMDSKKEHIPPITSKEKFVFPYKLSLKSMPINMVSKLKGQSIMPLSMLR